jgi:hypothetical protein
VPEPGDTAVPAPVPASEREGQVIATGIQAGRDELVFYAVRIHNSQLPRIRFGIMAGLRATIQTTASVTGLAAYTATGHLLPAGNTPTGHG